MGYGEMSSIHFNIMKAYNLKNITTDRRFKRLVTKIESFNVVLKIFKLKER